VVPPDNAQGEEGAKYIAKTLAAKTVYSVDDKSEYGVGLADIMNKTLEAEGSTVIKEACPKTKDYTSIAQKITNKNPDAVWYAGYYPELALLAKALKSAGYTKPLISGDGSNDDEYIKSADAGRRRGHLPPVPVR
jgi:branched-chain amino acid transport system substrate-binding protein